MDYSAHYARFHPETTEHDSSLKAILEKWLLPHLPTDRSMAVLDVGCGRGYAMRFLSELGYSDVSGIDIDAGQVAFALDRGLKSELVPDSAEYLSNRPATYGLVLLMDVLEHLDAPTRADLLTAIYNSLRPGGILICTVPNAASPVASYMRYVDYSHQTLFTVESLGFALSQSGFHVGHIGGAEFFYRPRFLFFLPSRRTCQWLLLKMARSCWRIYYVAELGFARGKNILISPNIIAVSSRQ